MTDVKHRRPKRAKAKRPKFEGRVGETDGSSDGKDGVMTAAVGLLTGIEHRRPKRAKAKARRSKEELEVQLQPGELRSNWFH